LWFVTALQSGQSARYDDCKIEKLWQNFHEITLQQDQLRSLSFNYCVFG
jgi:hypothetical protein